MMLGANSMRVMQILADATNTIAEGEVLQLMNCRDPDVNEARYLEVIRRKTAKLFEAAARLGAVIGAAPAPLEDGLAQYGMHLGTAFVTRSRYEDDLLSDGGTRKRYAGHHAQRSDPWQRADGHDGDFRGPRRGSFLALAAGPNRGVPAPVSAVSDAVLNFSRNDASGLSTASAEAFWRMLCRKRSPDSDSLVITCM
jgi:hypothetical protein